LLSERWETALALSAEIVRVKECRGLSALERARTRFNDYFPLLRLEKFDDARTLLMNCRAVFEAERSVPELGQVYSALAHLEDKVGGPDTAVRFEEVALGYKYQTGDPEDCAVSHNNLSVNLKRQGADTATFLAHRLAAASIVFQTRSGRLRDAVAGLANSALPPIPPEFEEIAHHVGAIEGVRFQALFDRLPRTVPDGDAALAAIWQLVAEERRRRLGGFEPLLQRIATAVNDEAPRAQIDQELSRVEEKGWRLTDPVHRIWAGERDAAALTVRLSDLQTSMIRRVLELLEQN
jgi:hypothetical protein